MYATPSSAERIPLPDPSRSAAVNSGFIIGRVADTVLIIGAPVVALIIAGPLFALPEANFTASLNGKSVDLRQLLITTFINAHLFLVYFRSHANPKIFRLYPLRFIAAPLLVFSLGVISPVGLGVLGLVAVWWDVYHSSMQTFGFGRIYDSKLRNDPALGRSLDYWMNLLVYAGPVLAGAHFLDHLRMSTEGLQFLTVEHGLINDLFSERSFDHLQGIRGSMAIVILAIGVPFMLYYVFSYYRLQQAGYCVSWQKVWLLGITSAVSIYCWGFRSFIDAFWVMNFFHALQYFAIVAFSEKQNLAQLFRVGQVSYGGAVAVFWVFSFCSLYGLWSSLFITGCWSGSLVVTTSIMHFWYDGFIWSVKKKQV